MLGTAPDPSGVLHNTSKYLLPRYLSAKGKVLNAETQLAPRVSISDCGHVFHI